MSESTQSVQAPIGSLGVAELGVAEGSATPSVRELLAELAALEDATRGLPEPAGPLAHLSCAVTAERLAALAREQEIIDELHRRCPDATDAC